MDAELGPDLMSSDPNPRSGNGDLLIVLCERNNLVNYITTDLLQGVITGQRVTIKGRKKAL